MKLGTKHPYYRESGFNILQMKGRTSRIGLTNSRERIAIRENGLTNSREGIAIRENKLSNSRKRISNPLEQITNPWERIAQLDITIYLWLFFY